jgi:hypothetical protein
MIFIEGCTRFWKKQARFFLITFQKQVGLLIDVDPCCAKNFTGVKVVGQGMTIVFYEFFMWIY